MSQITTETYKKEDIKQLLIEHINLKNVVNDVIKIVCILTLSHILSHLYQGRELFHNDFTISLIFMVLAYVIYDIIIDKPLEKFMIKLF